MYFAIRLHGDTKAHTFVACVTFKVCICSNSVLHDHNVGMQ